MWTVTTVLYLVHLCTGQSICLHHRIVQYRQAPFFSSRLHLLMVITISHLVIVVPYSSFSPVEGRPDTLHRVSFRRASELVLRCEPGPSLRQELAGFSGLLAPFQAGGHRHLGNLLPLRLRGCRRLGNRSHSRSTSIFISLPVGIDALCTAHRRMLLCRPPR
jgi:hypothetical protein